MLNKMQMAIVKKDMRAIMSNKRMRDVLIAVPLVLTVVVPLILIVVILIFPPDSPFIAQFSEVLDASGLGGIASMPPNEFRLALLTILLNNMLPLFFLIIPVTSSLVMAASAFVGEKEKSTLETLLYCPLSLKDIFRAKIMASFLVGLLVSAFSFVAMALAVQGLVALTTGALIRPGISWLIVMFIVSPAVSLIAINLIVRGSAKAQTSEESQQRGTFMLMPILFLIVGQFTGILMMSVMAFLVIGIILALVALFMFRGSFSKFRYETLLQ